MEKGDELYSVEYGEVVRYTYLCVYPTMDTYHILIKNGEPIKIYKETLNNLMRSKREAVQKSIHYHEQRVITIRERNVDLLK